MTTEPRSLMLNLAQAPMLLRGGQAAVSLAPRDAALLAWLALEGPTPRSRLATLLWPESAPEAARNTLRQRLFQLKKLLGVELVSGGTTLALAAGVLHDLHDSDSVLGDAAQAFSAELDAWLVQQRGRRHARMRQSLIELCEMTERLRDYAGALSHAGELLALDPLSEVAHRRVMRLHYLAGDRTAALLAFDRCEQVLKDEVGATPAAETLALLATVEHAARAAAERHALAVPAAVLRPPRLMGRDAERQALARVLHEELVVLLIGEAGMGKTRLIADCFDAAGASAAQAMPRVVVVGARPGDAAVPYAMAARLLRALLRALQVRGVQPSAAQRDALARILPEFSPVAPRTADDDRSRLRSAVQAQLERAVQQGLRALVIDDLQYADAPSIELLHPLVGGVACGWVVAMRPDELGAAAHTLVQAHAGSTRALTLPLQALNDEAIAALLDSLAIDGIGGLEQAASLRQRTGGNPLYLLETLKLALAAGDAGALVPLAGERGAAAPHARTIVWPRADNVQRLIQQRLVRLGPLSLKLARCAALAGQDLSPPLAAEVLGLRPLDLADAWAELEAAQVLREGAFAHDLIAEAALALVPQAIARTLHAEIACFLERHSGEAGRIAAHWIAAGEPLKAVPHLTAAARRAYAAWQRAEVAALHAQAAMILRAAGDRRGAFDAYFAAAEAASQSVGRVGFAAYGEALLELADDDGQRAAAALVPAAILIETRELDALRQLVLEALPRAQRADLPDIEVELLWDLVLLHHDRHELAEARQRVEQALERLPAINPATARLQQVGTRYKLTAALGTILSATGHYVQADAALVQALQQARLDGQWAYTGFVAGYLATNALEQGRLDQALDWSAQSTADDERFDGGEHERVLVASNRAVVLTLGGDLGGALAAAERAVAISEQANLRVQLGARLLLHALQFELGRRDLALKGVTALRARADLQLPDRIALEAERVRIGERLDSEALLEQIVGLDDFPLRVRLLCRVQPGCLPQHILPLLSLSAATARDQGAQGLWLTLQAHRAAALRLAGRASEAQELALALWQRVEDGITGIEMFPHLAAKLCAALAAAQTDPAVATHAEATQVIALRASAWMQHAAASLPATWRQNYLMRAPILQIMPPLARGLLMR